MLRKPADIYAALIIVALINVFPLATTMVGGDITFQLAMMNCSTEQFWKGDIYPRWCMSANNGLGLPTFILYFPLPFYVASLLHPLVQFAGGGLYTLYVMSCLLAVILAAFACYSWLRDIVSPRAAFLAAAVFIFLPYRNELAFFRAAYAELWCMAFLPLMFKYTRKAAHGQSAVAALSISTALALLSHVPAAIVGIFGCGLYVLFTTSLRDIRVKIRYGASVLWAALLTAFYVLPSL